MADSSKIQVIDRPEHSRFEAHRNGELAGVLGYEQRGDLLVALHTEVDPRFKGRGIGSELVRGMIDQLRADGRRLQPVCPFVKAWLERHPEQNDVLAGEGSA